MSDPGSPIIDFYPTNFELDLNGKKNDWEAIVKIPFIDEKRLLDALNAREAQLSQEERERNAHGLALSFKRDESLSYEFSSRFSGIFPPISQCKCRKEIFKLPLIKNGLVYGLIPGAKVGNNMLPGFPSMKTLPHIGTLGFHGVSPFKVESKNQSIVITLTNSEEIVDVKSLARQKIGMNIFVGWPFLTEAKLTSIMDQNSTYCLDNNGKLLITPHSQKSESHFFKSSESLESYYSKRYGVITGQVDVLFSCRLLKGLNLQDDSSLRKSFRDETVDFPMQVVIYDRKYEDIRYREQEPPPLNEAFPLNSKVFFLGGLNYGYLAEISGYSKDGVNIKVLVMFLSNK
jgi:5'-3' exoribonuclease 1